jgi:beta-phosphoglucomutase-like phosphatase (HAD superfamily)
MNLNREKNRLKAAIQQAKGIIFDMDGTILDSQEAHYRSWDRATRECGFPHPKADILAQFGKTTEAITIALCPAADAHEITMISNAKETYFLDEIPALALFKGITTLFATIKQAGKRICIASSNGDLAIEKILRHFQLDRVVDGFTGLDDIARGKPDPEMIVKSAVKLGLVPKDCIVVGDTAYDVIAGNAAGAFTVGVLTGTFTRDRLIAAGAGAVVPAAADLLCMVKAL